MGFRKSHIKKRVTIGNNVKGFKYQQAELAKYMSELSEEAYAAGWMSHLEYNLWQVMKGEISDYGI